MAKKQFTELAYKNANDLIFGDSLHPVTLRNGLVVGAGTVYPEVNFTLPPIRCDRDSDQPEVLQQYRDMITGIAKRMYELECPGFNAEFEVLPPMTWVPKYGTDVCKVLVEVCNEYQQKYGVKGSVRITPVDIREGHELEHMWRGSQWNRILQSFDECGKAGAAIFSIESLGGKGPHDEGLMYGEIKKNVWALSALSCPDMDKLWTEIVGIAGKTGATPGGDTACGFANTALALAEGGYISRVFSAVDRVMCAVRSLVAFECGCTGPDKDCGYEGPYIKAITGCPISMEGRVACCAHLSRQGNIACCMCDFWSNESVQNIKLLSGPAVTATAEQLVYDCRIMNLAKKKGKDTALKIRNLYAESDMWLEPQAFILAPENVIKIAGEIVKEKGYYNRVKRAAEATIEEISKSAKAGKLKLNKFEQEATAKLEKDIAALPGDLDTLTKDVIDDLENFDRKMYDM